MDFNKLMVGNGHICWLKTYAISAMLLALSSISFISGAQTNALTNTLISSPDTSKTGQEITAIPVQEISLESQNTINLVREIRNRLKSIDIQMDADTLLSKIDSTFRDMQEEAFRDSLAGYSLRGLEDLHRDFSQILLQMLDIQDRFDERRKEMDPDVASINQLKERWLKTREERSGENIPEPIKERIESVISEILSLDELVSQLNTELLIQEDRVTSMIIAVNDVLSELSARMDVSKERLFAIDSPPLWEMLKSGEDSISLLTNARQTFKSQKKDISTFGRLYKSNIRNHILFFLGLYILLLFFKYRVNRWSQEKQDAAAEISMHLINRPLSIALIIALLIEPLMYPEASKLVLRLIYLLSIIPILYLLPILLPFIKRMFIHLFAVLFLFNELAAFLGQYYVLDRLSLLAFNVVAIGILVFSLRSNSSLMKVFIEKQMKFTITILRVSLLLFVIGILTNVIGNTVLSRVSSNGGFVLIFAGVLLYIAATVLKSLIRLLLYSDESKKLFVVQKYPDEIRKGLYGIINIVAVFYWLYVVSNSFLIYDPIADWFAAFLSKRWEVGEVSIKLGTVLIFILTLWASLVLSKWIRILLQNEILIRFEMKRGVPGAISMMVRIALITIGFVLAFSAAGIDLSSITIIFGALGVGIGFGLQNIFNNLISGIIMAFERPVQVGDVMQIASLNLMGEVKDIGIRSSIVKTFDGAEVVVPNGNIISNEMINWTLSDRRRRQEIIVGVKYGTDLNKVLEILDEIVSDHPNVLKNPSPLIIFIGFGNSSLDFRVLFWTHFDVGLTTKSSVGVAIDEAFKKEGIEIPFPQRDLHLKTVGDGALELLGKSTSVNVKKRGAGKPSNVPTDQARNRKETGNKDGD